jgi:hypothetical protein
MTTLNWQSGTIDNHPWTSICFNDYYSNYYIVVSSDGYYMHGRNWASFDDPPKLIDASGTSWVSICFGHGNYGYVAVSSDGYATYTSDGSTWFNTSGVPNSSWSSVCFGRYISDSPLFVAVSTDRNCMYSADGLNWQVTTDLSGHSWTSVCYGYVNNTKHTFVAVSDDGNVAYSNDGNIWTVSDISGFQNISWSSVCYGSDSYGFEGFVAVAPGLTNYYHNGYYMYSTDGMAWTYGSETGPRFTNCLINAPLKVFASIGSYDDSGINSGTSTCIDVINGNWQNDQFSFNNGSDNAIWNTMCYGNGDFTAFSQFANGACYIITAYASCYVKGTKILCLIDNREEYTAVEDMRKGTLVKTFQHGYKPVELIGKANMVNNPRHPTKCVYKLKTNESTVITGAHYLLVDELPENLTKLQFYAKNLTIDSKKILLPCDSELFEPIHDEKLFETYHFVLDSDNDDVGFGVYIEGDILSESQCKKDFLKAGFKQL